jgi:hypothetical protein
MMQTRLASAVVLALGGYLSFAQAAPQERRNRTPSVPLADYHQHLFSPALAALVTTTMPVAAVKPRTAADLIEQLDAAGNGQSSCPRPISSSSLLETLITLQRSSNATMTGPANRSQRSRTV